MKKGMIGVEEWVGSQVVCKGRPGVGVIVQQKL